MRYAIVTETYPPEVNGVALTVQGLEQGLRARGHEVTADAPAPGRRRRCSGRRRPRMLVPRRAAAALPGLALRPARHAQADARTGSRHGRMRSTWPRKAPWAGRRCARRARLGHSRRHRLPHPLRRVHARLRRRVPGARPRCAGCAASTTVPTRPWCRRANCRQFLQVAAASTTWCGCRARSIPRCSIPHAATLRCAQQWGVDDERPRPRSTSAASPPEKNLDLAVRAFRELQQVAPGCALRLGRRRPGARATAAGQPGFHLLRHPARRGAGRGISPAATCSCSRATAKPSATSPWRQWPAACRPWRSTTAPRASTCATASTALRSAMATTTASSRPCVRIGTDDLTARRDAHAPAAHAVAALRPEQVAADFDALLHGLAQSRAATASPATTESGTGGRMNRRPCASA